MVRMYVDFDRASGGAVLDLRNHPSVFKTSEARSAPQSLRERIDSLAVLPFSFLLGHIIFNNLFVPLPVSTAFLGSGDDPSQSSLACRL